MLKRSKLVIVFILIAVFDQLQAQDTILSKYLLMDVEELINTKVTIATKTEQTISESPSIVSVITSTDIKNMGAREIEDVLQTIPGFELARSFGGYIGIGVRGVKDSKSTSKLLIMINGVPFNQVFYGNYPDWGYDLNLDAIDRIEIIRGPGSALYGRNAFSAVINIILKTGKTDDRLVVKGSLGTFNSRSVSGYYGYKKDKFNFSVAVKKIATDVADSKIKNDFGDLVKWNVYRNNFSINTTINYGKFSFTGIYFDLSGGAGIDDNIITNRIGNYSLVYSNNINSKFSISAKIYGHNSYYSEDLEQLKPNLNRVIPKSMGGNDTLTFATIYPNGIYYNPIVKEYLVGAETEIKYNLFKNNNILFGIQADLHGVYDVIIPSNYNFATGMAYSGKTRDNMTAYKPGWFENSKHNYQNIAFVIQDIWYPYKKLGITLGGRYDIENEIGGIFNPRAGIVLEPFKGSNLKLLYGKAYRAPSPSEQYVTLGYSYGNKDLKPEIINTFELAFSHHTEKMTNLISVFRNKLTDMIYVARTSYIDPNNKYYNIGENTSAGIEFENKTFLWNSLYTNINYSYTVSKNTDTREGIDSTYDHPDVSPQKLNLGLTYSYQNHFNINLNMLYRSKMEKFHITDSSSGSSTEVQDNVGDFAVFNGTFCVENLFKHFELATSVYNIFDTRYYSQDNQHLHQPRQPGRQFIMSLSCIF